MYVFFPVCCSGSISISAPDSGDPSSRDYLAAAVLGLAVLTLPTVACGGERDTTADDIAELRLEPSRTVITEESGLLAIVHDLAVDEEGNLFALDVMEEAVLMVPADGGEPRRIGREGEGPGEFEGPMAIGAGGGRLFVLEGGTGEVQRLDYQGTLLETVSVRPGASWGDVDSEGRAVVVDTVPHGEHLATVFDRRGNEVARIGDLVVPAVTAFNARELQEQVVAGEVPDAYRNQAVPALADDGRIWLFLQSEGILQAFGASGRRVASASFEIPEMELVFDEYVRVHRQGRVLYPLRYAADLAATAGRVWVLWNLPPESGVLVTVHRADARITHRVVLPALSHANALTVDVERRVLYLSLEDRSAIVAADLPGRLP